MAKDNRLKELYDALLDMQDLLNEPDLNDDELKTRAKILTLCDLIVEENTDGDEFDGIGDS